MLNHSSLPDKLLYIIVSILTKYRRQKILYIINIIYSKSLTTFLLLYIYDIDIPGRKILKILQPSASKFSRPNFPSYCK